MCDPLISSPSLSTVFGQAELAGIEAAWQRFTPFADTAFRQRFVDATRDLHRADRVGPDRRAAFEKLLSRWWELYVSSLLLHKGHQLWPRHEWPREWVGEGPDFCVLQGAHRVWIECVVPGAGDAADAIPQLVEREPFNAPATQILVRLLVKVKNKLKQRSKHQRHGIVRDTDGWILALNARAMSDVLLIDHFPPWIVRALYAIGNIALPVAGFQDRSIEPFLNRVSAVRRADGEEVRLGLFDDRSMPEVGGVLYSLTDFGNDAISFSSVDKAPIFVFNRTADVQLPRPWIEFAHQYDVVDRDGGSALRYDSPIVRSG